MIQLYLEDDFAAFQWKAYGNLHIKGYFESELIQEIRESKGDLTILTNLLREANGCFSFVLDLPEILICGVDRIRSFPLFYSFSENNFIISGSCSTLLEKKDSNPSFNKLNQQELLYSGYVTNDGTLIEDTFQVQAGEVVVWEKQKKSLNKNRYYQFKPLNFHSQDTSSLLKNLHNTHVSIFERLIQSLNDRPVVLPLSGGYDSRLVAVMLKELKYENVYCFTYGKPGSWEVEISRKVANQLGFPWTYIPYSRKSWYHWYNSPSRKEHLKFSSNFTSLSHLQDWPAVKELHERRLVPTDSIFIPGHSADFLEGSHIPSDFIDKDAITLRDIFKAIYKAHYNLWPLPFDKFLYLFESKIKESLNIKDTYSPAEAVAEFEKWDWQERQSKFIVNSVRVYDYFGYEWRLPLWDKSLLDFWSQIPLSQRYGRALYYSYANQYQNNFHIPPNPKQTVIKKLYSRLFDDWHGRISGNLFLGNALIQKVGSLIKKEDPIFNSIEKDKFIYFSNKTGLNSLLQLQEMDKLIQKQ